jgi:hypothetical protein
MTAQTPITKTIWDGSTVDPKDVAELARGIGQRLDGQPTRLIVELQALYTEPMYLQLDRNPMGITCLRVRKAANAESPVLSGSMVVWVWDSTRAKITSIDGMSVGSGVTYTFTFEAVFAPQVGS